MNLPEKFQDNNIGILHDDYILLSVLKKYAESGSYREQELYLLAKDFLISILSNKINKESSFAIHACNYTNRAEQFIVELLGSERLQMGNSISIQTRELFLLCLSVRVRICDKHLFDYIKNKNRFFAGKTDLWKDFESICNRRNTNEIQTNKINSINADSREFVIDVLNIVDKAFEYLDKKWISVTDRDNVDIIVKNGNSIQFSAFCNEPNDYYMIINHVNSFKQTLSDLYSKTANKKQCYKLQYNLYPIDRTINYDTDKYKIKPNMRITLNQINILNLLAGVKLYKEPYACLRELYQNSLDACRRRLCAKDNNIERGIIKFGIKKNNGKDSYLYCQDNGVGMDEHVIENYLLSIGNSYYKSDEFQQECKQMSNVFVPISQFGIGIISCFMIGSRIEIITKSIKPYSDFLYFCIGDVCGNIYYNRVISDEDKETIKQGGTVVRILLKEPYASVLHNRPFKNIGFMQKLITFPYKYANFKPYSQEELKEWDNHIFSILSSFVCRPPDKIDVCVDLENNLSYIQFPRQPYVLKKDELGITTTDIKVFEKYYSRFGAKDNIGNSCCTYYLDTIKVGGICFYPIVTLPFKNIRNEGSQSTYVFRNIHIYNTVGNKIMAVDGIFVNVVDTALSRFGMLDYTGEDMPKLSVDRRNVVSYSVNHKKKLKILEEIFKQRFKQLVTKHIIDFHLEKDENTLYCIKLISEEIGIS